MFELTPIIPVTLKLVVPTSIKENQIVPVFGEDIDTIVVIVMQSEPAMVEEI
jgi:hypothetical protein